MIEFAPSTPGKEGLARVFAERAVESFGAAGRHVVLVGEKWLQVVDATPFVASPVPAAPPASDSPGSASLE